MKKVTLGKTGIKVSRAGFGVLPMGPSQLALPVEEGAQIIRYALDHGINFLDTAQYYQTYPYIKAALEGWNGRDCNAKAVDGAGESSDNAGDGDEAWESSGSAGGGVEAWEFSRSAGGGDDSQNVVICSKSLAEDYDGMMDAIQEALIQLDRSQIDIILMHEVRSGQLGRRAGALQALQDARRRGLVRAIGLSTHHVDVVKAAAALDEIDVVFPLINYAGLGIRSGDNFASADEMLDAIQTCHDAGKGIFAMKAFGGGALTAHYQEALDYVFNQPCIDSVMIGFGKISDVDDLLSYLDGTMAPDYNPDVSKKQVHINQEDCEGCGACKNACPNSAIYWGDNGLAQVDYDKCLTCGYCSPVCPVRAVIMY